MKIAETVVKLMWHNGESNRRPKHRTYVSVLHGANVRSEAAVCGRSHFLRALVLLIQVHGKCGERIELPETESDIITVPVYKGTRGHTMTERWSSPPTCAELPGRGVIFQMSSLPGTTGTVSASGGGISSGSSSTLPCDHTDTKPKLDLNPSGGGTRVMLEAAKLNTRLLSFLSSELFLSVFLWESKVTGSTAYRDSVHLPYIAQSFFLLKKIIINNF